MISTLASVNVGDLDRQAGAALAGGSVAVIVPPCAATMLRHIDSPTPFMLPPAR